MKQQLLPLFDSISHLNKNLENVILPAPHCQDDFQHTLNFLKSYTGSMGTFNSYRREAERLLQWTWHIKKTTLNRLKRQDVEEFIHFCQKPPKTWTSLKKVPRYIEKEAKRIPNSQWRPFIIAINKKSKMFGAGLTTEQFRLSTGSIQELFAILSTLFNFLISEEYLVANPVALIRQKSKFLRKRSSAPVRRLSIIQWQAVLHAALQMAQINPFKHERTLFILSALYGMYLRISELAANARWTPTMNNFTKDYDGNWWFTTVGKGNKERQIAVSDDMLASLMRWRRFLGLTALPSAADHTPLIPKIRGTGALSDTVPIRRLVQECFDLAGHNLRANNQLEEADYLAAATVHWLRHTAISEDVKIRPREHVRDDAGHSSSATTDRYINIEMKERHKSARQKVIARLND